MNKNIVIVLGGAILAAVLVAMLVQVSLGGKKEKSTESVEILVAAADLKVGKELEVGDMQWQDWPKGSMFSGAIVREGEQDVADALEGRLRRDVAKGEPLLKNSILKETKANFVAASLEPGMRAMAIKVDAESMVAGFISPGDYVDVVLTYKQSIKAEEDDPRFQALVDLNLEKMATETIMQHVQVLAIDQTAEREDDEKIAVGKTVTLAVPMQDAEKLALATEMGTLVLVLRGVGDNEVVTHKWPTITDARLTTIGDEIHTEVEKMKKDSGVNRNIVRIYNGVDVQNVSVK